LLQRARRQRPGGNDQRCRPRER
ncbi:MAG: hypothetical protein JSV68_23890, partial [Anaerolineaceae bacterium]